MYWGEVVWALAVVMEIDTNARENRASRSLLMS